MEQTPNPWNSLLEGQTLKASASPVLTFLKKNKEDLQELYKGDITVILDYFVRTDGNIEFTFDIYSEVHDRLIGRLFSIVINDLLSSEGYFCSKLLELVQDFRGIEELEDILTNIIKKHPSKWINLFLEALK